MVAVGVKDTEAAMKSNTVLKRSSNQESWKRHVAIFEDASYSWLNNSMPIEFNGSIGLNANGILLRV